MRRNSGKGRRASAHAGRGQRRPAAEQWVERLEARCLLAIDASTALSLSTVHFEPTAEVFGSHGNSQPLGSVGPVGFQPAQIRHAYGLDQISFNGGITGDGTGQTIAIVDAYDTPNILAELQAFDAHFGIPDPPTFTKLAQDGSTNYPAVDPKGPGTNNWELETALDVEWTHALAPGANIVLVEAANNGAALDDIAVPFAASYPGVSVVSMSFGSGEFSGENSLDQFFTTPSGHAGVTFIASTGDNGSPGEYPAYSPNVLAVGGTSLTLNAQNQINSETAWSGSGGGISSFEPQPSYQAGVVTQSTTQRTIPDIAFDANPSTGVTIYDSYNSGTATPWEQIGGTSVSAPCWAATIAIANQGRNIAGLANLDGRTGTLPAIYSLPNSDFHDITSGSNGGFSAAAGYDLVTGRGSPNAPLVVNGLVGTSTISGAVYSDTNGNGVEDATEGGLEGWTVYEDLNNNGVLDPPASSTVNSPNAPKTIPARSSITSTTTVSGYVGGIIDLNVNLSITISRASNLILTLTGPDGTSVSLASRNGGTTANFTNTTFDDQASTSVSSGTAPFTGSFKPIGSLAAFNGKTANGVWTLTVNGTNSTAAGTLSNWSLQFVNPTEPSVTTGAGGDYDLPVTAGTYHIREVPQAGFSATGPAGGVANVSVTTGQNSLGNNFGNLPSSISGTVFDDANDNGIFDAGESATPGAVFDDLNNNGVYDSTSQWTINSADVSRSIPANSTIVSSTIVDDLAGAITDLNVNLSINESRDSNLSVTLIGPDGTRVNLLNHNGGTGVNFVNTTLDDQAATAITSGSAPFTGSFKPASVLTAFNGKDPNGTWRLLIADPTSPNTGTLAAWSLSFTTNASEPLVLSNTGNYQFANLVPGTHTIRQYIFGDTAQTAPASGAYTVSVAGQTTVTNANFGNHAASISGTVFLDANNNGTFGAGDAGLGGWLVYDDLNNDGTFNQPTEFDGAAVDDPQPLTALSTATSTINVTGQSGPLTDVTVTLSLHYPTDSNLLITLTDPDGNTIDLDDLATTGQNMIGTTFDDAGANLAWGTAPYSGTFAPSGALSSLAGDDANGVWQLKVTSQSATDTGTLDGWSLHVNAGSTEPNTITAPDGSFEFDDVPEGDHIIRVVPAAGYTETSPSGGAYDINVVTGSYVTGTNFGFVPATSPTPAAPVLLPASDTGALNNDNITRLNNSDAAHELQFQVAGTIAGATVVLAADGVTIGSAVASGSSTTITTSGAFTLTDGSHQITAAQTAQGASASAISAALAVQIDATPPTATITAIAPQPQTSAVGNMTIVFNEPVSGLDLSDLSLSLGAGPNLLSAAQSVSSSDGLTWTLSNLAPLTATTGTYELALNPVGTPIIDVAGNSLASGTSTVLAIDLSPPLIDLNGAASGAGYAAVWSGAGPVNIADPAAASIVDNFSTTLTSLTVAIAAPQPGDALSASTAGTSIIASYAAGVLNLTGNDTVADYQQVLRSVQYNNTGGAVSGNVVALSVVASDGVLASVTVASSITIDTVPPTVGLAGPTTATIGQSLTFTLSANDPLPAEQAAGFAFAINWGDGSAVQVLAGASGIQASHAYSSVNLYTVSVTATNANGLVSAAATQGITVSQPVTAGISGPSDALRGAQQTFTLTASDPSPADQAGNFTFTINWGDGSTPQTVTGISGAHVIHGFNAAGALSITVTATDQDNVTSAPVTQAVQVDAVQLRANAQNPALVDLVWGGTSGADSVQISQLGASAGGGVTIRVHETSLNGAAVNNTQDFPGITGRVVATGDAGNDLLDASGLSTTQATLDGGADNNTLYGGQAGDILIGGSNGGKGKQGSNVIIAGNGNNTIYGNDITGAEGATGGSNLIVGGTGHDTIYGSFAKVVTSSGAPSNGGEGGQNLIIGGGGGDTIYASQTADGAEGGHGSILIAGQTTLSQIALQSVLTEWTSTDTLAAKIADISGTGTGPRSNGNNFLIAGSTVTDDGVPDQLYSDTNGQANWLFDSAVQDAANRVKATDNTTDLG